MSDQDKIRQRVAKTYARAVSAPTESGCCSGPVVRGVAAATAGYSSEELSSLPDDAVVNSFGCGNPVAFAEVASGDVVLDLGSGAGIDLLLAARQVGEAGQAIGIDMTDEMLERAKQNIEASGLGNAEVRQGTIENLPVDDGSVDWIFSNCVINLSPEKEKVFAEIARVLRPGGRISISDIVVRDLPDWVLQNPALYDTCVAGAISEEEYVQGLERAGLEEVQVKDRLVYGATQIAGIVKSELPDVLDAVCCGSAISNAVLPEIARNLEGKIWSARFTGRKPLS